MIDKVEFNCDCDVVEVVVDDNRIEIRSDNNFIVEIVGKVGLIKVRKEAVISSWNSGQIKLQIGDTGDILIAVGTKVLNVRLVNNTCTLTMIEPKINKRC